MRVLIIIREGVLPFVDQVLANLIKITSIICTNPSNPTFYYYHFEAIGAIIRFTAPIQSVELEQKLFQPLAYILQIDVPEFTPYVFQLFAAMLEGNQAGALPAEYKGLLGPITTLEPYDIKGNVPALVRMLTAFIPRAAEQIIEDSYLEKILLVYQKLITGKKSTELYGFDVIEAIFRTIPMTAIGPFIQTVFRLILTRLELNPSESFKNRFVKFYHLICTRDGTHGMGADWCISQIDSIQAEPSIYVPIYLKLVLPSTTTLTRPIDRKVAVISLTKTLADSQAFANKYQKGWGFTCNTLLKLLENPPVVANTDDVIAEADVDDLAFGVGFTQLHTCKKAAKDEWPEVQDVKGWVGNYLKVADGRHGGKIAGYVDGRLDAQAKAVLLSYMR